MREAADAILLCDASKPAACVRQFEFRELLCVLKCLLDPVCHVALSRACHRLQGKGDHRFRGICELLQTQYLNAIVSAISPVAGRYGCNCVRQLMSMDVYHDYEHERVYARRLLSQSGTMVSCD